MFRWAVALVVPLLLALVPSAGSQFTATAGFHDLAVQDLVVSTVLLQPDAAVAYHSVRPSGVALEYSVKVVSGSAIDIYLMPAPEYISYRAHGQGQYFVKYSRQAATELTQVFNSNDYLDVVLLVENMEGTTGADPEGPATVSISIRQGRPTAVETGMGVLAGAGIVAALGLAGVAIRRAAGVRRAPLPPPPEDPLPPSPPP
jgi:hypothetical protein